MNITILVPTKNRPNFIRRQLEYYSDSGFDGEIFIGDSSNLKLFNETKSNIFKYGSNLIIHHFYLPNYIAAKAVAFISSKVETDYSVNVPDDDIVLTNIIPKCISFLDKNHDYVGVHGKGFLMSLRTDSLHFGTIDSFKEYSFIESVEDSALARVKGFFDNTKNVDIVILRSDVNMQGYSQHNHLSDYYSSFVVGELAHATVVLARGKVGMIEGAYAIRQSHNQQFYNSLNFEKWFFDPDWMDSFNFLKGLIDKEIIENESIKGSSLSHISSNFLSNYLKRLLFEYSKKKRNLALKKSSLQRFKSLLKKSYLIKKIIGRFNKENNIFSSLDPQLKDDINVYLDKVTKK